MRGHLRTKRERSLTSAANAGRVLAEALSRPAAAPSRALRRVTATAASSEAVTCARAAVPAATPLHWKQLAGVAPSSATAASDDESRPLPRMLFISGKHTHVPPECCPLHVHSGT